MAVAAAQLSERFVLQRGTPAAKSGALYTPISATIPDTSQRARLMPLVGKYVRARGRVFERASMKAIALEQIDIVDDQTPDANSDNGPRTPR
jgi:hypothetical protein